jgi:hypothetical protein
LYVYINNVTNSNDMTRKLHQNSLNNLKQTRKPVEWNDQTFESGADLMRHLGVGNSAVSLSIKHRTKLKGHYVEFKK